MSMSEEERADLHRCAALVTQALDRLDEAVALAKEPTSVELVSRARLYVDRAHRELFARSEAAREEARGQ